MDRNGVFFRLNMSDFPSYVNVYKRVNLIKSHEPIIFLWFSYVFFCLPWSDFCQPWSHHEASLCQLGKLAPRRIRCGSVRWRFWCVWAEWKAGNGTPFISAIKSLCWPMVLACFGMFWVVQIALQALIVETGTGFMEHLQEHPVIWWDHMRFAPQWHGSHIMKVNHCLNRFPHSCLCKKNWRLVVNMSCKQICFHDYYSDRQTLQHLISNL